jgi:hypothetical protein
MAIFATANGLYTSENGVISLMNAARAITPDNLNNFLSDEESSLLRLIDICETQENDFFNIFNVEGNTIIEKVNNFQKRVDEYNKAVSGIESWLTNKVYAILAEL